jgi:hypothetical protein
MRRFERHEHGLKNNIKMVSLSTAVTYYPLRGATDPEHGPTQFLHSNHLPDYTASHRIAETVQGGGLSPASNRIHPQAMY